MIKGAQKQMIVLKTAASRYFDEAYFVLRTDLKPSKRDHADLLTEANRILKECEGARGGKKQGKRTALWFALGALSGGMIATAVFLAMNFF